MPRHTDGGLHSETTQPGFMRVAPVVYRAARRAVLGVAPWDSRRLSRGLRGDFPVVPSAVLRIAP
eukprot:9870444-Alexandrium_andersonii.AAC.1